MEVRPAERSERPAVMTVLDSALLAVEVAEVRAAFEAGNVLLAVKGDRVLGALVLTSGAPSEPTRIEAIAVRRARRGQGIGSTLVQEAAARHGRLVAEFDAAVRPFWASLGFRVEPAGAAGRFVGTLAAGG